MAEAKTFELKHPFEHKGASYERITLREPKVRDLKSFLRNMDKGDSIAAFEKVIADLSELDEKIITELHIKDFVPIKTWFEDFLKDEETE